MKETIPSYSFTAWNVFIRENFIDNSFRLNILKLIFLSNGIYFYLFKNLKFYKFEESVYLNDVIISILANLISIFHDKEIKDKPFMTLKFIFKTLCSKEMIPSYFKYLEIILNKIKIQSIIDMLMLIFNFLIQFQTLALKNANSIPKAQLKNYELNLKAILTDEIENIVDQYGFLISSFKLNS